jgi:hypothetical protein
MFTMIAFFVIAGIAFFADRQHKHDSSDLDINVKQVRQDLRLIAYELAAVLVMLGVIADKIH